MNRIMWMRFALVLLLLPPGALSAEVVAVVSARSPITALDSGQVADIFLGKTSRFPDGSQAVPIDQDEDSPARERFYAQFTGKSPAQVKAHWSKIIFTGRGQPPRQPGSAEAVRRAIADNPRAIGYLDTAQLDSSVRALGAK